jgi:hypothetical protein
MSCPRPGTEGTVAGEVFGRRLSVREHRVWSHSAERTILDGQTVWHQYPEGGHRVVADDRGHLMDLYEGAVPGRLMGLDVFDQPRLIAYLPTAGDGDLERDLILFQIAAFYLERFDDHLRIVRARLCAIDIMCDAAPAACGIAVLFYVNTVLWRAAR